MCVQFVCACIACLFLGFIARAAKDWYTHETESPMASQARAINQLAHGISPAANSTTILGSGTYGSTKSGQTWAPCVDMPANSLQVAHMSLMMPNSKGNMQKHVGTGQAWKYTSCAKVQELGACATFASLCCKTCTSNGNGNASPTPGSSSNRSAAAPIPQGYTRFTTPGALNAALNASSGSGSQSSSAPDIKVWFTASIPTHCNVQFSEVTKCIVANVRYGAKCHEAKIWKGYVSRNGEWKTHCAEHMQIRVPNGRSLAFVGPKSGSRAVVPYPINSSGTFVLQNVHKIGYGTKCIVAHGGAVTIANSMLTDGKTAMGGGAIDATGTAITITNSIIAGNGGTPSAAIKAAGGTLSIAHSVVRDNSGYGFKSGVITGSSGAVVTFLNVSFVNNGEEGGFGCDTGGWSFDMIVKKGTTSPTTKFQHTCGTTKAPTAGSWSSGAGTSSWSGPAPSGHRKAQRHVLQKMIFSFLGLA